MNKASYDYMSRNMLNVVYKMHPEQKIIEHSAFSFYDLLSYLGGLLYSLLLLFTFLLASFPDFQFHLHAMERLFKAHSLQPSAIFQRTGSPNSKEPQSNPDDFER